tara:strand:+ start:795 stop:1802 length:1008 start_codon:yes stop_codon:yes gene_type:complete
MKFDFSFKIFKKKIGKTIVIDDKKLLKDMVGIDFEKIISGITDGAMGAITGVMENLFTSAFDPIDSFLKGLIKNITNSFKKIGKMFAIPLKFISKNLSIFGKIIKNLFKGFVKILKPVIKMISGFFSSLGKIITSIFKKLVKLIKPVIKMFVKVFGIIVKFMKKIFNIIAGVFVQLFERLKSVFETIIFYIVCTFNKIIGFDECFIYYCVDVILFICLIPLNILFWMIPPLQILEDSGKDAIELVDGMIYDFTLSAFGKGFHINQWPNDVMNKCYRCKPKEEKIEKGLFLKELEEFFTNKNNFFHFTFRCTAIIFSMIVVGIYIYSMFTRKKCGS